MLEQSQSRDGSPMVSPDPHSDPLLIFYLHKEQLGSGKLAVPAQSTCVCLSNDKPFTIGS